MSGLTVTTSKILKKGEEPKKEIKHSKKEIKQPKKEIKSHPKEIKHSKREIKPYKKEIIRSQMEKSNNLQQFIDNKKASQHS